MYCEVVGHPPAPLHEGQWPQWINQPYPYPYLYNDLSTLPDHPCQPHKHLNVSSMPACPRHQGFDFFAGSEIPFIIVWTCIGLLPLGECPFCLCAPSASVPLLPLCPFCLCAPSASVPLLPLCPFCLWWVFLLLLVSVPSACGWVPCSCGNVSLLCWILCCSDNILHLGVHFVHFVHIYVKLCYSDDQCLFMETAWASLC